MPLNQVVVAFSRQVDKRALRSGSAPHGPLSCEAFTKNQIACTFSFSSVCKRTIRYPEIVMKISNAMWIGSIGSTLCLVMGGCASDPNRVGVTNQRHIGPAAGRAIGTGIGVIGGNVAGAAVGLGEGVAQGTAAPFNNTTRVVRRWHTETTADGRTIQIPEDIVVDQYGRPVNAPSVPRN